MDQIELEKLQAQQAALQHSWDTEHRWMVFMVEQNYPIHSPKWQDASRRLEERRESLYQVDLKLRSQT